MFICGSGSFGHEDEAENEAYTSPCRTPKRSKRSTSFCKVLSRENNNKNPFADRGLDKFYALLADLDDKKQKIYKQKGSEDISFVRFVIDESDKVKPIVVKVKEKKSENDSKSLIEQKSFKSTQSDASDKINSPKEESKNDEKQKKRRSLRCNGSFKLENLKQPQIYFLAMVVVILVLLVMYGRSFAILCSSIGWYLAPTIGGGSDSSERKPKRKKSERKIVNSAAPSSPTSVINGLNDERVQQRKQFDRKKSW